MEGGITRKSMKCSQITLQGSLFSRNWRQKFASRRPWDVQRQMPLIRETVCPYVHQGAARPTRPLALERRRLLLELGTARRLRSTSGDQSLVEKAKTGVTRVERQMRRFSRWLLRRRRANWLEELEEGIRTQDAFTVYRYARLLVGTGMGSKNQRFGQIRAYTPSQIEMGIRCGKRRTKGRSCSARILLDRLPTRASGTSGPW